jgi:hypothetical protein
MRHTPAMRCGQKLIKRAHMPNKRARQARRIIPVNIGKLFTCLGLAHTPI